MRQETGLRRREWQRRSAEDLEKQLESMLDIEKFPPPEEFSKQALVTDESIYEEAAKDLEGFWSRQAEELIDWVEKPTQTLDESNAPFYKWFADGKLNVVPQLPGPPRRGGQRRPRRLPLARRGGRGARHHLRRAPRRRPALRQRAQGPRHRQGRRRRHLPADDPRGRRRDARLRAHRRPPQRRLRRLLPEAVRERMEFSEAKALITVDGARRKGKTAPIKSAVDKEGSATSPRSRRSSSSRPPAPTAR